MGKNKTTYNIINFIVIFVAAFLFIHDYRNVKEVFTGKNFISITVLFLAVVMVHVVKASRLYLVLYGSDIDTVSYIKIYCKVTPVSVIIPCKIGELFRIYCYGKQLDSVLKGAVIVFFDRFMDTIALVTFILLIWIFNGGHMVSFVYILVIFLILVLFTYFAYPRIYIYWKHYLLRSRATEKKMTVLRILEKLNMLYCEIENVAKGKGIILYFMSLIAWGVELGSLILLNGISDKGNIVQIISGYLASAMNGGQTVEFKQFVIASVGILIAWYLIIKGALMVFREEVRE